MRRGKKRNPQRYTKDDEGPPSETAVPHRHGLRTGNPARVLLRSKSDGRRRPPGARASRPHAIPLRAAQFPCDTAPVHPAGGNAMGPAEAESWRRCRSTRVEEMAEAVPRLVRAGRPRSRVGILHTINREHGFHPALESGEKLGSALECHSPLAGESARQGRSPPSSRWGANAASRGRPPFPAKNPAY